MEMKKMTADEKWEMVARYIDNPSDISDDEYAEIRELLPTVNLVSQSYAGKIDVDRELDIFRCRRGVFRRRIMRNVAAVFVGVLLAGGIAIAVVRPQFSQIKTTEVLKATEMNEILELTTPSESFVEESGHMNDTIIEFRNAELGEILKVIAATYHVDYRVDCEETSRLRIYTRFDSREGIEATISNLNHFNRVNLYFDGQTIVVAR